MDKITRLLQGDVVELRNVCGVTVNAVALPMLPTQRDEEGGRMRISPYDDQYSAEELRLIDLRWAAVTELVGIMNRDGYDVPDLTNENFWVTPDWIATLIAILRVRQDQWADAINPNYPLMVLALDRDRNKVNPETIDHRLAGMAETVAAALATA